MEETFRTDIEYRSIPGWPAYRAGADGSIWTCFRKGPGSPMTDRWRRMRPQPRRNGYLQVELRGGDGRKRLVQIQILILETFAGPRPEGYVARHFPDRDRGNCAANNLVWGTHQQNCEDRARDGKTVVGERNNRSKITEADVRVIRAAKGRGAVAAMERQFGLSRSTVIAIRKRRTWKHVL